MRALQPRSLFENQRRSFVCRKSPGKSNRQCVLIQRVRRIAQVGCCSAMSNRLLRQPLLFYIFVSAWLRMLNSLCQNSNLSRALKLSPQKHWRSWLLISKIW